MSDSIRDEHIDLKLFKTKSDPVKDPFSSVCRNMQEDFKTAEERRGQPSVS